MFQLKDSYLCKTHMESLFLQTGLWSLGLILATGLWQRQQCLQAETQKTFGFSHTALQLVIPLSVAVQYSTQYSQSY